MSNEELVDEIQKENNVQENMLLLYEQNLNYIKTIAKKYSKKVEMVDLLQDAYISLVNAVKCFESGRGASFITYYGYCLKQGYIRLLNTNNVFSMSDVIAKEIYDYKKLCSVCLNELNRYPTDNECKVLLKCNDKKLKSIMEYIEREKVKSIDEPILSAEGNEISLGETIPDDEDKMQEIEEDIYNAELHQALCDALSDINTINADILKKRFFDSVTYTQIAKERGVSPQRINEYAKNGLKKLRKGKHATILKAYLDNYEDMIGNSYKSGYKRFCYNGSTTENIAINLYRNKEDFVNRMCKLIQKT